MKIIEIILKLSVTIFTVWLFYVGFLFLIGLWRSQIDPKTTITRILEKLKPNTEIIAVRDPGKIYQNGEAVGNVDGDVKIVGNRIIFGILSNTGNLDPKIPFEYQRYKIRLLSRGQWTGVEIRASPKGSTTVTDVLRGAICEIIE